MVVRRMAMRGGVFVRSGLLALAFGAAAVSAHAQSPARPVIGAPYRADGLWWVPAVQPNYEAVGEAGVAPLVRDAGGDLTAAHATLPLPSLVEVTNLDTGRTARIRLTTRGATAPGRVLDLSTAAARALGVEGSARIRVKLVPEGRPSKAHVETIAPPAAPTNLAGERQATATSGFAVQAGAFGDRERAQRAAERLGSAGRAEVSVAERDGRRLWRVTLPAVGPAAAEAMRGQVVALGFADARVVRGS